MKRETLVALGLWNFFWFWVVAILAEWSPGWVWPVLLVWATVLLVTAASAEEKWRSA